MSTRTNQGRSQLLAEIERLERELASVMPLLKEVHRLAVMTEDLEQEVSNNAIRWARSQWRALPADVRAVVKADTG